MVATTTEIQALVAGTTTEPYPMIKQYGESQSMTSTTAMTAVPARRMFGLMSTSQTGTDQKVSC